MLADGFILWSIPAQGRRLIKTSLCARKHFNCPSLARGTSNLVAEGDGFHANLTDAACRVPTTTQTNQLSLLVKRDEQRSCGGRLKCSNLSDTACRLPTTFAVYVILNEVKNLSLRVIRYFTALRSVHDSVRVVCHSERSEESLTSRNKILHFTTLRSV